MVNVLKAGRITIAYLEDLKKRRIKHNKYFHGRNINDFEHIDILITGLKKMFPPEQNATN